VEADSNVDIEIGSLYNIISEYLKPEQKGRQVVEDVPQLRTILLTLHHKLKDQAKNIQRDKAKKYLEDCCYILEKLDTRLKLLTRMRRGFENQLRKEWRTEDARREIARAGYEYFVAAEDLPKESVQTVTFVDLNISKLALDLVYVEHTSFLATYDQVKKILDSKFLDNLPAEREERGKYLLNLISLLPDILDYVRRTNRNHLLEPCFCQNLQSDNQ